MKVSIKGFIYHKDAESYDDCFDRLGVNAQTDKFSVSDGVSKSFFPGIWAEVLVDSFINKDGRVNLFDVKSIKLMQEKWIAKVTEIVNRPNQKYFVRNFFAQGRSAAATFVGLSFLKEDSKLKWEAFALGDSFLFFVPDSINDLTFEFDKITYLSSKKDFEFDNFPDFFDSRNNINKGKIKQTKHDLKAGTFYLMTDALSEWFILEKRNAIGEINQWRNQKDFEKRIPELRKSNLQNDDSAILIIKVEDDSLPQISYRSINVSDLDKLSSNEYRSNFDEEVDLISDKFNSNIISIISEVKDEIVEEEKAIVENSDHNVSEFENINHSELENKIRFSNVSDMMPQKEERGFWEKKMEAFLDFLPFFKHKSPKNHKKDLEHQNIQKDKLQAEDDINSNLNNIEKNDVKSRHPELPNDIDSITDKF